MSIQRLAVELIGQIVENISPDSHLSFALTSKRHLACSETMLARHREYSIKHKETTDIFEDFSIPEDPVASFHNRAFVAYRAFNIAEALQIPTLRLLEVRRFHDEYDRGKFNPAELPKGFKSSIESLYFNHVPSISKMQLRGLMKSFRALRILRVKSCTSFSARKLISFVAAHHFDTMEIIHFGRDQTLRGEGNHRLYCTQVLSRFQRLRHLVVDLADIYRCTACASDFGLQNETDDVLLYNALSAVFLPSLESLVINMTWNRGHFGDTLTPAGPADGELETIDKTIARVLEALADSGDYNLRRLDLTWTQIEFCNPAPFLTGGVYLNRFFPNVGGFNTSGPSHCTAKLYPFFDRTITAGHNTGVVVETFHHSKSMCAKCKVFPRMKTSACEFLKD